MIDAVRSTGWTVFPSFVPNGPTSPVTLLLDDQGVTQLVGEPVVAWQTPWSELSHLQLIRFAPGAVLFATIAGVRYSWRTTQRRQFEALAPIIAAHGGTITRRRRRAGAALVALVVVLGSLVGGLGAWLNRARVPSELTATRALNITLNDLPSGYSTAPPSLLSYLFTPSNQVVTPTPTTAPVPNSNWSRISGLFQRCIGVPASRDRVYGAAGQQPDYQVSSPVYTSLTGDVLVASTAQYYHTTTMVSRDVAEMTRANFATCFATSQAALLFTVVGATLPTSDIATSWTPSTFVHGFVRAGIVPLALSGKLQYLVMVTAASGHVELTLGALVSSWAGSKAQLETLTSTLLSRALTPSSRAI